MDCWCDSGSKTIQVLGAFGQHNGGPTPADSLNDIITNETVTSVIRD